MAQVLGPVLVPSERPLEAQQEELSAPLQEAPLGKRFGTAQKQPAKLLLMSGEKLYQELGQQQGLLDVPSPVFLVFKIG